MLFSHINSFLLTVSPYGDVNDKKHNKYNYVRIHPSGQHGDIITDLSCITTAKQLVKRAIVEVERDDNIASLQSANSLASLPVQ